MLTLLTTIRNEEKYITEWLAYYHLIGIENFIVFLHKNTDNSYEVIKNLSFKDQIQIIKIEEENSIGIHFQNNILRQAIELCDTEYLIYLDIDEFLYLNNNHYINDFLANYKDIGGIAIYQNIFGSCGHIISPKGLVIENYVHRNYDNIHLSKTSLLFLKPVDLFAEVKILLNKNTIQHIRTIHDIVCSKKIITQDGSLFQKHKLKRTTDNICIHHYFTKSKNDWEFKTGRQRISGSSKYSNDFFEYFSNQNYLDENLKNKYASKIKALL
jgi:hypothetical protein